eukprot:3854473-Prymnesium_polylepis.1
MCAACVGYGGGYGTTTRHTIRRGYACGDANDTTEPHTIAYTSLRVWQADGARARSGDARQTRRSHA